MKKEILFIPGFMDCGEIHGYKNSLDIWEHKIDFNKKITADYVVGYSAGGLLALHYWKNNKNFFLILINPIIVKKKLFVRFLKMMKYEGTHISFRRLKVMFHLVSGIFKLKKLLLIDSIEIIKQIPKDKILIIRGKNDKYIFNEASVEILKKEGKDVIEIDEVGHNSTLKIKKNIEEYIKNSF